MNRRGFFSIFALPVVVVPAVGAEAKRGATVETVERLRRELERDRAARYADTVQIVKDAQKSVLCEPEPAVSGISGVENDEKQSEPQGAEDEPRADTELREWYDRHRTVPGGRCARRSLVGRPERPHHSARLTRPIVDNLHTMA